MVVRQLVIFLAVFDLRDGRIKINAVRIGGRDQPDFAVQNSDQLFEIFRAIAVTRSFQEFLVGPHVAYDIRSLLREQHLQNGTCSFLVKAVFGWSGGYLFAITQTAVPFCFPSDHAIGTKLAYLYPFYAATRANEVLLVESVGWLVMRLIDTIGVSTMHSFVMTRGEAAGKGQMAWWRKRPIEAQAQLREQRAA